jgi:hypothetical protein
MIDQDDNDKNVFDAYTLNTIKSMASAMRFFAMVNVVCTGAVIVFVLYLFIISIKPDFIQVIFLCGYLGFSIYVNIELLKCSNAFKYCIQTLNVQNFDLAFRSMNLYWRYFGIQLLLSILLSILFSEVFLAFLTTLYTQIGLQR